ncbi:hypothetical protein FHS89_002022 [Rubricella aquisinus]|uniref:GSCFA domain-containing protein n=1 Tax=Rubricella aquisinus TaxID=2028108 RepID=A0A840WQP4_9RHOB|nr:GSCFA domain-containing protein [Rubricella aquisinus]MBB5516002.1 hypothetical protein [Rubricella aquisinus]
MALRPGDPSEPISALDHHDAPFAYTFGQETGSASQSWFRGHIARFNPTAAQMRDADAVPQHILAGFLPPTPVIGPDTRVLAFGSCFAIHVTRWLANRSYTVLNTDDARKDAYIVRFGEGLVNSFVLRQQFEWALEGARFPTALWYDDAGTAHPYSDDIRQQTRAMILDTDVFILTLGLSEIWYDIPSGGVFWRAVPEPVFDPQRHGFRTSTVAENRDNILAIQALIRKHRPDARVIFTLSPIPLVATFRPMPTIPANAVSKATLRAALDEAMNAARDPRLHYWPAYEIVMDAFDNRWLPDRRHVKREVLDYVLTLFETFWCHGSTPRITPVEALVHARAATGALPPTLSRAIKNGNTGRLERLLASLSDADDVSLILAAARDAGHRMTNSAGDALRTWLKTR